MRIPPWFDVLLSQAGRRPYSPQRWRVSRILNTQITLALTEISLILDEIDYIGIASALES